MKDSDAELILSKQYKVDNMHTIIIHIIFLFLNKEESKILIQEDFGHVLGNRSHLTSGKK